MGNLSTKTSLPPLQTVPKCDTSKFMGTWFVIGVKPTYPERTCSNSVEKYTLVAGKKGAGHDVDIDFQYNAKEPLSSKLKSLPQKGYIEGDDKSNSATWKVSPLWPLKLPYLIIELDEQNYHYTVIGYPSRAYAWIMCRQPTMDDETYNMLTSRLKDKHGYDLDGLRKVPQVWTKEERQKRSLEDVIPDDMLSKE